MGEGERRERGGRATEEGERRERGVLFFLLSDQGSLAEGRAREEGERMEREGTERGRERGGRGGRREGCVW